jgi:hypothetical protein
MKAQKRLPGMVAARVTVCDLRESKRIGGDAIAVGVADAARAIAPASSYFAFYFFPCAWHTRFKLYEIKPASGGGAGGSAPGIEG